MLNWGRCKEEYLAAAVQCLTCCSYLPAPPQASSLLAMVHGAWGDSADFAALPLWRKYPQPLQGQWDRHCIALAREPITGSQCNLTRRYHPVRSGKKNISAEACPCAPGIGQNMLVPWLEPPGSNRKCTSWTLKECTFPTTYWPDLLKYWIAMVLQVTVLARLHSLIWIGACCLHSDLAGGLQPGTAQPAIGLILLCSCLSWVPKSASAQWVTGHLAWATLPAATSGLRLSHKNIVRIQPTC